MKTDAIAVANFFIRRATEEETELTLLKLLKLVYIGYGFCLALLHRSILNDNFDWVEAWKYGPVIPSVYHTFKHNGKNPIKTEGTVVRDFDDNGEPCIETPRVEDDDVKLVLNTVWKRYRDINAATLVNLLHQDNTPWAFCYVPGENIEIPESVTTVYYEMLIKSIANGRA